MTQTRTGRIERLVSGVEDGSGIVAPGFDSQAQPMHIGIGGVTYRVFSWEISHGGKGRHPDEYRVQTTRPGEAPFLVPGERTLLIGYHDDLDVFAAWDVRMHPDPSVSSSLQVRLPVLRKAAEEGIASQSRPIGDETEIVVAFRPEATPTYLEMAALLPAPGASSTDVEATERAAGGETVPVAELPEDVERRREIRVIEEKVRDQRFRHKVVAAYDGRCAFCGLGGGLTQAAHIDGLGEGGPDLVVNGLCACPNHHAAFDRGLIAVGAGNAIEVSEEKLRARGCDDADVEGFRTGLFDQLALPPAAQNHPDPARLAAHRERWQ
jgi:putative restriction endonuclease